MTILQHVLVVKNMQNKRVVTPRKINKHANNTELHVLSSTLHSNKKDKMLFVLLQFNTYENHGLLDTRAV